jgi:hypothetical protein
MEKHGFVIHKSSKGWLLLTAILCCLVIIGLLTKNKQHMNAAKSIQGMLYQAGTNAPIEGAMVMIAEGDFEHPDIAAQSDAQGRFNLPSIQVPGSYTLLINYHERSKTVKVNITGDSVLRIAL